MKKTGIISLLLLLQLIAFSGHSRNIKNRGLEMAVKMANSEIKQFPEPWTVDFNPRPVWNYTQGLVALSMMRLWQENQNEAFYDYAKMYADKMIDASGNITGYKMEDYNIDCVNSGKFLFDLYAKTKDEKYRKAIILLRNQLKTQPRTSEGGFWHKQRYPFQMWLDGLYMGAPFYAQYAKVFNEPALFDDVTDQFLIVHKHTYDPKTGLNYHGWDESKQQKWADPITGCSPNFWGRAEGWYAMALVDVLDFLPATHPGRAKLLGILNQVAAGIKKHQDPKTGLWYQVMDQGTREGNYLEATGSAMFAYTLLKAVRKGYIPTDYKAVGTKGYIGMLENLMKDNGNGTISLTKCCGGAGLGGNPYRDGSYDYYIREEVRDNDPKGVGPFIMASIEYLAQDRKLIAFPGAEGYGRFAQGGRGGDVYHVTNLNDSGSGSLRQGLETVTGPRTVVFDVSGNIRLKSILRLKEKAFVTVAGQTAPGDGITVCDQTLNLSKCHDIIIRYIRMRLGDRDSSKGGADVLSTDDVDNLMMDHVSLSWAIDGTHDLKRCGNFTLQWSILGEALNHSLHKEGAHAMLGSYRNPTDNLTLHHNIFTTSRDRHPTLGSGGSQEYLGHIVDFRNNIIYNWSKKVYSDESDGQSGATNFCDNMVVAVNNLWRPGPESDPKIRPISIKSDQITGPSGFMRGNVFDKNEQWTQDNYAAVNFERYHVHPGYQYRGTLNDWKRPMPDLGENTPAFQPTMKAYELVLKNSGASLKRDAVDKRLANNIRNRTGQLIDSQEQVGGWPELKSLPSPKDSDGDGMPDRWEKQNRLNPNDPEDRNGDTNKDGFTNLEEYLNSLTNIIKAK
jgi:unsaturated rhamnogalacturonyl hydrolase